MASRGKIDFARLDMETSELIHDAMDHQPSELDRVENMCPECYAIGISKHRFTCSQHSQNFRVKNAKVQHEDLSD